MKKRILCGALAIVMCCSALSPAVFAAETVGEENIPSISDTTEPITGQNFLITLRRPNGATLPEQITYTGEDQKPTVSVQRMGVELTENTDYTAQIEGDTKNVGTFTATITGIGKYSGTVTKTYTITPCDISNEWLMVSSVVYNGETQKPTVNNWSTLTEGADFKVTWPEEADLVNTGDIPVTITGVGPNCFGTIEDTFSIRPASIRSAEVQDIQLGDTPSAAVVLNGKTLEQKDYTFAYNAGDKTFTVTGIGNYGGSISGCCQVQDDILFAAYPLSFTYNGQEQKPAVLLTPKGNAVLDSDYNVSFDPDTVNAGEKTVTVTCDGATYTANYTIAPYALRDSQLQIAPNSTEDGEQRPDIRLKDVPGDHEEDTGYTVTIPADAKTSDSYEITVTGQGNYTGEIKKIYEKKAGSASVSLDGWNYGEAANAPSVASSNGIDHAVITYSPKGTNNFTSEVPNEPGDYTVKAVFPATLSYKEASATADFTISFRQSVVQTLEDGSTRSGILEYSILDENSAALIGYTGDLTELTLPAKVHGRTLTRIEDNTFKDDTALEKAVIPATVLCIGDSAFYGCTKLKTMTMLNDAAESPAAPAAFAVNARADVLPEEGTVIKHWAFWNCENLVEVQIKNGTTAIEEGAFEKCGNLQSISIPNTVTTMGDNVFSRCYKLDNVTIPDSVTSMGDGLFYGCVGLKSVKLPSGLKALPTGTFWNCTALETVTLPGGLTSIGDRAFFCNSDRSDRESDAISSLSNITIPAGVTSIGNDAFQNCGKLNNISFPASLKTIGAQAFMDCEGLTGVKLPDSLTSIGDRAFLNCSNLAEARLPKNLTSLGESTFAWTAITDVTIPSGVKTIKKGTFNTANLEKVTISEGVERIEDDAFRCAWALERVDFPSTLKALGCFAQKVDDWYSAIDTIYFRGNAPAFQGDTFQDITATAYYPEGNKTWTSSVMKDYGGRITWKSYPLDPSESKLPEEPEKPGKSGFIDVPADTYYSAAVDWAVENEITSGTSATTFSPNAICTRGQVVTFLWRANGKPAPKSTVCPFTDIKPGDYFYEAVLWAVDNGITSGTSATTFSPNTSCSRSQVVTFLWRAENKPAVSAANPFADIDGGAYYYDAVLWAVGNGITSGTSKATFSPDTTCTRAQIVVFLYRDLVR